MTPLEEQVEKLAWEWGESAKQLEALARSGGDEESAAWVAGASAAREEDIDDLRALLPLEVTDESVTVTLSRKEIEAVFEAMSTGYSHEGPMDQHLFKERALRDFVTALDALDFPPGGDEQEQTEGEAGLPPGGAGGRVGRLDRAARALAKASSDGCFDRLDAIDKMDREGNYSPEFIAAERGSDAEDAVHYTYLASAVIGAIDSPSGGDETNDALIDTKDHGRSASGAGGREGDAEYMALLDRIERFTDNVPDIVVWAWNASDETTPITFPTITDWQEWSRKCASVDCGGDCPPWGCLCVGEADPANETRRGSVAKEKETTS